MLHSFSVLLENYFKFSLWTSPYIEEDKLRDIMQNHNIYLNSILKNSLANVPVLYDFKNIDIFCFYFDEISIMSFNVCPQTQIRTHTNVDFPTSHPPFSIYKWSCHGMVSEIMVQFVNVNVFDSYLSTYLAEWAIQTKKLSPLLSIYSILKLSVWKNGWTFINMSCTITVLYAEMLKTDTH